MAWGCSQNVVDKGHAPRSHPQPDIQIKPERQESFHTRPAPWVLCDLGQA